MEGQIAGRTVTLYNECGSAGGGEMGKISHLLTVWVSEWAAEAATAARVEYVDVTTNPLRDVSPLCVWQELTTRKSHKSKCKHNNNNKHTAYIQTCLRTVFHKHIHKYTHAHTYVLCTHSPHKPFPSISLQFFKKLTPLTIVAKQQEQQQQQRHRWLRRRRCDVDASHSQKVRASTGKRQRRIVVEDDFNVFTKSKLDALL